MNEGSRGEVTLGGVTERLLGSEEPAVRYKLLTKVLGREPASVAVLREEIRASPRVRRLLSERGEDGKIPFHPYAKCQPPGVRSSIGTARASGPLTSS